MTAGVTDRLWAIGDIVALVEAAEVKPGKRERYKESPAAADGREQLHTCCGVTMNPAYRRCSTHVPPLAIVLAMLVGGAASASELVDVRSLVEGLERGCRLSEPLKAFRSELNQRYTFEAGASRLRKKIRVPAEYARAIGRVSASNHGEYTMIVIPLTGIYRGLPTRSLIFNIGHSNGINVIELAFDATRSEVQRIVGRDVANSQKRFEDDPEEKEFGFSVRIADAPRGSVLICDTST